MFRLVLDLREAPKEIEKLFSLFEKKLSDLDRKVNEELAGINAGQNSILDVAKAGPERPASQLNRKHARRLGLEMGHQGQPIGLVGLKPR